MKKSIFAALFHVRHQKKNNWHDHCPKGKDSWCKFQQDAVNATNTYIPGADQVSHSQWFHMLSQYFWSYPKTLFYRNAYMGKHKTRTNRLTG